MSIPSLDSLLALALAADEPTLSFDLVHMWRAMGPFARFIAGVLAVMSVYSLGVMSERLVTYRRATKASRRYAEQLRTLLPAGKLAEAERLYAQLGRDVCNSNHDLAMRCYNRLEYLRNTSRPTFQEVGYSGLGQDNRLYPVPMNANGQPLVCYAPCAPAAGQPPPPAAPAQDLAATTAPQASGAGRLRLAGRGVDYRRAYVLENSQGQLLMYVTAAQGVDLEPYVNRNVDLYGPIVYRGDLRANYLTALRVTPMP